MFTQQRIEAALAITLVLLLSSAAVGETTTAPAATTKPAATTEPAAETKPAAKPEVTTEPAIKTAPPSVKPPQTEPPVASPSTSLGTGKVKPPVVSEVEPANIRFQFEGETYRDVVRFISRAAGKPVIGDLKPIEGTLTYFDAKPYTYPEAIGIVNQFLQLRGFTLMETNRYLKLVPLKDVARQGDLPIVHAGLDVEPRRRGEQIVTTIIPLHYIDAADIIDAVKPMIHSFGTVSTMGKGKGKGIIITDCIGNIRRIQRLLSAIDKGSLAEQQLKYYRLKTASATDVANLIKQLFAAPKKPTTPQRRFVGSRTRRRAVPAPQAPAEAPDTPVTVAADARSNTVIVICSPYKHAIIAELIASVDVDKPADAETSIIRIVKLKNAKAADLAKTIIATVGTKIVTVTNPKTKKTMTQKVPLAQVMADVATNRLVISASPDIMKKIEGIITEIDADAVQAGTIRIFALKHAKAEQIAPTLQRIFSPQQRRGRPAKAMTFPVTIVADKRTNSLVVSATADDFAKVERMLASLDVKPADEAKIQIRSYALIKANAKEAARSLSRLFASQRGPKTEPQPRFEAESKSNQLIVAATAEQFETIDKLIKQMQTVTKLTLQMRIFQLKYARAEEIAQVLEKIFQPKKEQTRDWWGNVVGQPGESKVRIATQKKANAVIIQGSPEAIAFAEQIIKQFDTETVSDIVIEIVPLVKAEAVSLAKAVNQALAEEVESTQGYRPQPWWGQPPERDKDRDKPIVERAVVVPEPNSNSLLVRGPKAEVANAVALIKRLDAGGAGTGAQVRVFAVKHAEVGRLSKTIEVLFEQIISQQRRRGRSNRDAPAPSSFSIAADERTSALIVSTSPANFAVVESLIKQLDVKENVAMRQMQYTPLLHADAFKLAGRIDAMFADRRRSDQPLIEADTLGNGLTIVAKEADLKTIETIIAKADEAAKENYIQVRVVPLWPEIRAERMAEILKNVYEQVSGNEVEITDKLPKRSTEGDSKDLFMLEAPADPPAIGPSTSLGTGKVEPPAEPATQPGKTPTEKPLKAKDKTSSKPPVIIAVDKASNSLIISASRAELDNIELLIWNLTINASTGEAEMRVFKVKNADPVFIVKTLNALVNPKSAARAPRPTKKTDKKTQPAPAPTKSVATIVADVRTRSIIVRAKRVEMDLIETLIKQLDTPAKVVSIVRIFALKNTDAVEVAANLRELFGLSGPTAKNARGQEFSRRLLEIQKAGGAGGVDTSSGVTISSNKTTNSVIVAAPAEAMELAARLIEELDQAPVVGATEVRIFKVKNADVTEVAEAVSRLFAGQRAAVRRPGRRGQAADKGVVVTSNERRRIVIVSARADEMTLVEKVITELDTVEAARATVVKVYRLDHTDARSVARALTETLAKSTTGQVAAATIRIAADRSGNAVIVRAGQDQHKRIAELITQLDQTPRAEPAFVTIRLERADASDVVTSLRQMLRSWGGRRNQVRPTVAFDQATNTLMISGLEKDIEKITEMVKRIDQTSPTRPNLHLIQLQNAEPEDVLKAIEQIFGGGSANGAAPSRRGRSRSDNRRANPRKGSSPHATALPGQRALLVSASDKDWETIRKIITSLDEAAAGAKRLVKIFPLNNAANNRVATALNRMYRTAARSGKPGDVVSVVPMSGSNAVVVTATKDKMDEVASLIKQLDDVKIAGKMQFRLFGLTNTGATKILPLLRQMIRPLQQARPGQPINISADQRANAIIVTTQSPVMDEIERIINLLDKATPFKTADVAIFPLTNADAPALAAVLSNILTPGTVRVRTPEARALQEQVRLLRMRKGAEALPLLDLSKPIKISSDPARSGQNGSNSLIVSSTPDNIKAMGEIIALLDTMPIAAGVKLKMVHLVNSDAISVMTLLRSIFTQGPRLAGRAGTPVAGKARPETLTGEALTGVLNITADARTNTLILAGSAETLTLAMLIVKDLDLKPPSEFTQVKLFKLAHADAGRLAGLIRAVFAERPSGVPGVAGARAYVTKLRMLRERKLPVQTDVARSYPTMVVQAEPSANILIVAARSDLIGIVAEMVATMDIPGAGAMNVVRIYPLKNADATRTANVIEKLYTGPNARLIRPEDRPTISVDTRTNSLIVASSDKTFAMIDSLLGKLDAKLPIELRDIRLLGLENADAASLATTLQKMMDARVKRQQSLGVGDAEALQMLIIPDARSNCLIVGGSAEGFKLVADLAKQLDSAAPALSGKIQLITLKNANAGTLGATLNNLFDQRYSAARTPELRRQKPVIVPDLRTNLLMVAANQDDSRIIASLVGKLDAKPVSPAVELAVIALKYNDAGTVGPMIQRVFADRLKAMTPAGQQAVPQDVVSVAADALGNALIISASKENLQLVRSLVAKVDLAPPTETGVVRIYQLKHADAQRVSGMLDALVQKGLYKPGLVGAADNAIARAREKVSIASDARTNVLIISASRENFAVIEQIIGRIDTKEGWGLAGAVKVYVLKHADAARLGPTLQQMFDRKRAAEAATGGQPRSLPVVIIPDERTNSLLVAAGRENAAAMDALVTRLDIAEVAPTYDFRVFYLKEASAAALQPTLKQLFAQRATRGPAASAVTVIADPKTNSLIIGAARDELTIAAGLIARLDKPVPAAGQAFKAFSIIKADAAELAKTLKQLYEDTKPTGGDTGMAITVDERSNTILVAAAKVDMKNIAEMVKKLDTAPVTDVTEIRIFTLRHADAKQLATILTDALTNKPKPLTTVSPNRATLLRFIANSPEGKQLMSSALKAGVMITAVPRTNSLLVQAPVETMPLLARLIRALDNTDPRMAEICVFTLTNADATQMARVLTELFRLQQASADKQAARYTMPVSAGGEKAAAATLGSAEQTALTITVDQRTNSLLVGGTREYISLVGRVISQLDASPAEDRHTLVYRLRNAQAVDIEKALTSFLDQERRRVVATLGADAVGAAKALLAREVAVVAEATSNTLLISGSPRFFKTVTAMIREMDQPPPQVLVQVLLVEVTLDDTIDFGVQWSHLGKPGTDERTRSQTQFGITAGATGFTFSLTGGDLDLLLRALQTQGRTELLSRPQILASDNQEAQINIGQRVPFITASRTTDTGTINTIQYEPIGIILNVTPHINPDGFIKMEINPEISSLSTSSVQISENVNAIIINNRSAKTTVTVQNGHTIVIGGLITSRDEKREEKIPFLGDIPIIGHLFKNTRHVKEKTELLIILTPRILRTPSEADVLTGQMIRRLPAKTIHADESFGGLLNPLRDFSPTEIKRLKDAAIMKPARSGPVIIPMTPTDEKKDNSQKKWTNGKDI